MKICPDCGRSFNESGRHRRCGTCRGKDKCRCGRLKGRKAKQCQACLATKRRLKNMGKKKPVKKVEQGHGTRARYQGTRLVDPCRCEACTAANNVYMREYRNPELHRSQEPIHEYRSELTQ